MKSWILSIVSIIFIILIFSIFLPESKLGKYAKSIISIFILIITISPIKELSISTYNSEEVFNENLSIQEDYLYYIYDYKAKAIKDECNKILHELRIENALVDLEYEINDSFKFSIKEVKINLSESVINLPQEHKYIIDEIKNEISKQVGINKEFVIVYE